MLQVFCNASNKFNHAMTKKNDKPDSQPCATASTSTEPNQDQGFFLSEFYDTNNQPTKSVSIHSGISKYLKDDIKPKDTNILAYWSNCKSKYPGLLQMAHCLLAIPAMSAASKRVFSEGCHIIFWQRLSLKPQTVEELLCMKEWGPMIDLIL